jgi:hypothetical protein
MVYQPPIVRTIQFPKKFTRTDEEVKPVAIIRCSGEAGNIKLKEYRLIKEVGKMGVYK